MARSRRRGPEGGPPKSSGKATTSLVMGILSLCLCVPALPGLILGLLALRDINRSNGRLRGHGIALAGIILSCLSFALVGPALAIGLLLPAVQKVREAAARLNEQNNLKQIAIAMHIFNDSTGALPAAAGRLPEGGPAISWRVQLLPYLEQDHLFRQYRRDEPWDGPNNQQFLSMMPKTYQSPAAPPTAPDRTYFQVLVGPGTLFERPVPLGDVPDGLPNTVLAVLGQPPVPWTSPQDIPYDPNGPLPRFADHHRGGFNVAMADGSVRFVPARVSERSWRAAISRNGGDAPGPDW